MAAAVVQRPQLTLKGLILPILLPHFFASIAKEIVVPVLPVFAHEELGAPSSLIGMALASLGLAKLLSNSFCGPVIRKCGPRAGMIMSLTVQTAAALLAAASTSMYMLVAARMLTGVGMAGMMVSQQVFISASVSVAARGKAASIYGGLQRLGAVVAPILGGVIASKWSARTTLGAQGFWAGLAALMVMLFLPAWDLAPGSIETPNAVGDKAEAHPKLPRSLSTLSSNLSRGLAGEAFLGMDGAASDPGTMHRSKRHSTAKRQGSTASDIARHSTGSPAGPRRGSSSASLEQPPGPRNEPRRSQSAEGVGQSPPSLPPTRTDSAMVQIELHVGETFAEKLGPAAQTSQSTDACGPLDHLATEADDDKAADSRTPSPRKPPTMWQLAKEFRHELVTVGTFCGLLIFVREARTLIFPLAGESFGMSPTSLGLALSASSMCDVALCWLSGIIMDNFGRKWNGVIAPTTMAIGFLIVPFGKSALVWFVVGLCIVGLGNSLSSGLVFALGTDHAPRRGRAQFIAVYRMTTDTGLIMGPLSGGIIAQVGSLHVAAWMTTAVAIIAAIWMYCCVKETLQLDTASDDDTDSDNDTELADAFSSQPRGARGTPSAGNTATRRRLSKDSRFSRSFSRGFSRAASHGTARAMSRGLSTGLLSGVWADLEGTADGELSLPVRSEHGAEVGMPYDREAQRANERRRWQRHRSGSVGSDTQGDRPRRGRQHYVNRGTPSVVSGCDSGSFVSMGQRPAPPAAAAAAAGAIQAGGAGYGVALPYEPVAKPEPASPASPAVHPRPSPAGASQPALALAATAPVVRGDVVVTPMAALMSSKLVMPASDESASDVVSAVAARTGDAGALVGSDKHRVAVDAANVRRKAVTLEFAPSLPPSGEPASAVGQNPTALPAPACAAPTATTQPTPPPTTDGGPGSLVTTNGTRVDVAEGATDPTALAAQLQAAQALVAEQARQLQELNAALARARETAGSAEAVADTDHPSAANR